MTKEQNKRWSTLLFNAHAEWGEQDKFLNYIESLEKRIEELENAPQNIVFGQEPTLSGMRKIDPRKNQPKGL